MPWDHLLTQLNSKESLAQLVESLELQNRNQKIIQLA
jgi:hypothetical protein